LKKKNIEIGISQLLTGDPKLGRLIGLYQKQIPKRRKPGFDSLSRIIVSQQLSGKAAQSIYTRVLDICSEKELTTKAVLNASAESLRKAGISWSKVSFLKGVANTIATENNFLSSLATMDDDQAIKHLTKLKGVGDWTASVYLIFCDERLNIFPHGDGSVNRAIFELYNFDPSKNPAALNELREAWAPYNSLVAQLLWCWVDDSFSGRTK